jgi:hypothetical protein
MEAKVYKSSNGSGALRIFVQMVPAFDEFLIRNFNRCLPVPYLMKEEHEASMPMDDAEKFREYAAECRRLAQKAASQDKAVLLEIANAWIACADEAECKANNVTKKT